MKPHPFSTGAAQLEEKLSIIRLKKPCVWNIVFKFFIFYFSSTYEIKLVDETTKYL